jgi:DNA-binding MarR family transcriptional regulator
MPLVHNSKKKRTTNRFGRTFITHLTQLDKQQIDILMALYHHFGEDMTEITNQMNMIYMDQCH